MRRRGEDQQQHGQQSRGDGENAQCGFVDVCEEVGQRYGIPIVNKRISVSPVAVAAGGFTAEQMVAVAEGLDDIARELRCDFLGGFSALVERVTSTMSVVNRAMSAVRHAASFAWSTDTGIVT